MKELFRERSLGDSTQYLGKRCHQHSLVNLLSDFTDKFFNRKILLYGVSLCFLLLDRGNIF